jgi:hypothetical protein
VVVGCVLFCLFCWIIYSLENVGLYSEPLTGTLHLFFFKAGSEKTHHSDHMSDESSKTLSTR